MRTRRSAIAFAFGDLTRVLTPAVPSWPNREPNVRPYTASRSWIRSVGWQLQGGASITWRQIHAAFGLTVTVK